MTAYGKTVRVLDTPATALTKSNTNILTPAENLGRPFATLGALAGIVLSAIENDHGETIYIVSKWALTRELPDLEAVSPWFQKVTGVRS